MMDFSQRLQLRLPATSANLGPAFDTAAVALNLHLEVTARPEETFSISARGRDAAICERLDRNLIVETYRHILLKNNRSVQPLHLEVNNEIPLGMGCGSSAAARLTGIVLAVRFGKIDWGDEDIIAAATHLEGHPDNVTACWLGGMTVSTVDRSVKDEPAALETLRVHVARFDIPEHWRAVVLFPLDPVRTEESRKLLPSHYSRADVVENLQRCSLLVAAFATGNNNLLRTAMVDRLHQPYRRGICSLLRELPLLEAIPGVLGAALSGAGPGLLLIVERDLAPGSLEARLRETLSNCPSFEILQCGFEGQGADSTMHREGTLTVAAGMSGLSDK